MSKIIKLNVGKEKILKYFRECLDTESINLQTEKGHIYKVGGILCKIEGNKHFIADKKKRWVLV